jgi:hypothetical protein
MDPWESPVERVIREAQERGEFDDLPGAGKPLRGMGASDVDDPDWWVKQLVQREQVDMTGAMPPAVALRKERATFPESLVELRREESVRAVLEDFNRRVRLDRLRPTIGPLPPLLAPTVDVDDMVRRWRELRAAMSTGGEQGPPLHEHAPERAPDQEGFVGTTDRMDFDTRAAVTRSMLGWGVLAGPLYLATGLALALTRDWFDLGRHPLSLLMLGEHGWVQRANLLLGGVLVLVAAVGARRALGHASRAVPVLLGVAGVGLLGSGTFAPDPMAGFPAGASEEATASGLLHLASGVVTFGALGAAAIVAGRWFAARGEAGAARGSRAGGLVVLVGFVGGGALAQSSAGVALLWVAVVAAYAWLAWFSVRLYRTVPHPDRFRARAA